MHELGVTFTVLNNVLDIAKKNNVKKVRSVTLELGQVSTVIPAYLEDCWNWACSKHEETKGCKLIIDRIRAITICLDCGKKYPTIIYKKVCPQCGSEHTELFQGNEFVIKEITVDDSEEEGNDLKEGDQ